MILILQDAFNPKEFLAGSGGRKIRIAAVVCFSLTERFSFTSSKTKRLC
jgi:hypothetical protein